MKSLEEMVSENLVGKTVKYLDGLPFVKGVVTSVWFGYNNHSFLVTVKTDDGQEHKAVVDFKERIFAE